MIGIGLAVAFLGGVVSFASPCCLPLVPAYVGYMVGASEEGKASRRRTATHAMAFVMGFSIVFVAFWASIGTIGLLLADNARYLRQLGGALLIFLGLQVAGVINIRALWRDTRPLPVFAGGVMGASGSIGGPMATPGYGRSLLLGTLFAAGWSPCIGPILGGIIGLASASGTVAEGTVLLIAFAAGLAIPFLAVALGAASVARHLTWVSRHHHAVSLVTGGFLVLIGVLMVTGLLNRLASLTAPLGA